LVYGKTVNPIWYLNWLGKKKESAVGFVLVDTRTKETTFINKVAPLNLLLKALREVQEKGYRLHIPYNINNIPPM
jgi:hypothetical protein